MTRLTTYLFITLAVLIVMGFVYENYHKVWVTSAHETADVIRKAGK